MKNNYSYFATLYIDGVAVTSFEGGDLSFPYTFDRAHRIVSDWRKDHPKPKWWQFWRSRVNISAFIYRGGIEVWSLSE